MPTSTPVPVPVATQESDPYGKLLAIYMVGSDLEENDQAGTTDLRELIEGYESLSNQEEIVVVVAFGGANKDGWRGMKLADIDQLMADAQDSEFGNENSPDAYIYYDDQADMDDENSLKLFLDYLRDGYTDLDQRFLTFWDHGASYGGFGGDTNFNDDIPMSLAEMEWAFKRSQPGGFDLIGFDACLMASMEVARFIEPYADYMIASEELEPGHGWLWSAVIEHYAQEDSIEEAGKRMVDNFVQDVHDYEDKGKTLSLLDLSRYDQLVAALNPVISAYDERLFHNSVYSNSLIEGSTKVRSYGESEKDAPRLSIDLMHFTQILAQTLPDPEVSPKLEELMDAIGRFVVHSNHDGSRTNSFGIAIDAPENAGQEYAAYKVNDTWLDFQNTFFEFRQTDTEPPELVAEFADSDGIYATFDDENLSYVTSLYGFIETVEYEDGAVEDYFMVVAEEETFPTEIEGQYFAPAWDKYWFTVEYDPDVLTAWIPASFDSWFEEDGQQYSIYTAEIDYYRAGQSEADPAVMTLVVDATWEVVYHDIQTYQYIFSGPDDEEDTVRFDKATYQISPGDAVQFWNFGFHLEDPDKDDWFMASDVITFVQEPFFLLELLEFEDEFGQPIEYLHWFWAEDISGNAAIS